MVAKYKEYTVKELKRALQNLKSNKGDLSEIKYVSRTLRNKLQNKNNSANGLSCSNDELFNHDKYLGRSFWGYVKRVINKKEALLPSFNITLHYITYFIDIPNRVFQ